MKRRRSGWRFRSVGRVSRGRDELGSRASPSAREMDRGGYKHVIAANPLIPVTSLRFLHFQVFATAISVYDTR